MRRAVFVLHSALAPDAVADALRRSIDERHWTIFSLSGYRGSRPLLGDVGENTFTLQRRKRYSRSDSADRLYARFEPRPGGTRIEGYFDYPRGTKYFWRIWLAFALLVGMPIFAETVIDMVTGSDHIRGNKWVGLVVPPVLVLYGILWPKFCRLLGKRDELFILEHLQDTLAARIEEPESRLHMGNY